MDHPIRSKGADKRAMADLSSTTRQKIEAEPAADLASIKKCYCYLLECADGTYYTGWTTDPGRRERQHNLGTGARYTSTRRPVRLVYVEPQADRSAALRRERKLKTFTHAQKKALIASSGAL